MKKILFALIVLLCGAQVMAQSTARIFLSHKGETTIFKGMEMEKAIAASVDGDTIYLSEGNFSGGFAINKKISLIGAGQGTTIKGDIDIAIPDSVVLTSGLLQGMIVEGNISVTKPVCNMIIKKVKVTNNINLDKAMVSDALFDNCFIERIVTDNNFNNQCSVVGSWVHWVSNEALHFSFLNCNIWFMYDRFQGECINCIVDQTDGAIADATFTKTLYNLSFVSRLALYNDCWTYSYYYNHDTEVFDAASGEFLIPYDQYLGTDGTVIGYHGGPSPFTLEMKTPKVTELKTAVSDDTKTLKVNAKISAH